MVAVVVVMVDLLRLFGNFGTVSGKFVFHLIRKVRAARLSHFLR